MRIFAIASAVLMFSAATALADKAAVPVSTLDSMGLTGMDTLSDQDGLEVRGKGIFDSFVGQVISGFSFDFPGIDPPTPDQPSSPFDSSPFGGNSLLGNFQGGSHQFGSGPSIGGNSFGFGPNLP